MLQMHNNPMKNAAHKEGSEECRVQKSVLNGSHNGSLNGSHNGSLNGSYNESVNGSVNGQITPLKSLQPPYCNKQFENVDEYLLEVRKALGERQSFYSINLADVVWKVQNWHVKMPNIAPYYAVKANMDPVILRLLVLLGCSFDCATEGEIQSLLDVGAPPSSILWAHTVKPVEELLYAKRVGVDYLTFDDEEELKKIHKFFPEARLLLRICPSKVFCRLDLSIKFGCSQAQAIDMLRLAQELNMNVIGICFHVGGLCDNVESFTSSVKDCRKIFDDAQQMGLRLSVLDIGAGYFGSTERDHKFDEVASGIRESLEENFGDMDVKVIAEPGCYMVASCSDLISTVLGKRTVVEKDGIVHKYYFMNSGTYGSFFKDVIECYDVKGRVLLNESELMSRPAYKSTLYGQTCCQMDVIQANWLIPELQYGDCVLWNNMGAYSRTRCSTFNGVPLPLEVYIYDPDSKRTNDEIVVGEEVQEFLKEHAVFFRR